VAELLGIPSLPFAVGIYLPLSTMTPVFVGGAVRHFIEKRKGSEELKATRKEKGVLLGSGFIAGEGILMVFVAIYAYFAKARPKGIGLVWPGNVGDFIALAAFIALVAYLLVKSYKK
jgi:uncharacterized oligopeptide transporter (OPT) family protein